MLCADEKSQVQALERSQPLLPLDFDQPERRTHTYTRHGTTNLFAALDYKTGKVIGECHPHKRAAEFRRFLMTIDENVPANLGVHLIVDNSSIQAADREPAVRGKQPGANMSMKRIGSATSSERNQATARSWMARPASPPTITPRQ